MSLAFVIGVLSLLYLPDRSWLPVACSLSLALSVGFLGIKKISVCSWVEGSKAFSYLRAGQSVCFFLSVMCLGCVYALVRSHGVLQWSLPLSLETKTIEVVGQIVSIPQIQREKAEFKFRLTSLNKQAQSALIQLSWYHYPQTMPLHIGDIWRFQVRLKRPRTLLNPGGFDYEKWLFSQGIRATGYIVHPEQSRLLGSVSWRHPVDKLREILQTKLSTHLHQEAAAGLVIALIMGGQEGISKEQWQIMRATGTNHLMAIAGVHIAFVSGFVHYCVNHLWRRSMWLMVRIPAPIAAGCGALGSAVIYSALAGFSLPTQRALIMLSLFLGSLFLKRVLNPWTAFILALGLVVGWDPFCVLSISFWLSFGAVFSIIYGISGRLRPKGLWWKYGRVQWSITVCLLPISLCLFQESSLISLVANLIAVPAVGILVLPLCLGGACFLYLWPWAAHHLLVWSAKITSIIWVILGKLGGIKWAVWQHVMPNGWIACAACVGVLWLLSPKGFPTRYMGIVWLSPLFFFRFPVPDYGVVRFALLDVGQGLSVVIQTQKHVLVYDAGPPLGEEDAGQRVILPYLKNKGMTKIDTFVISHGDSDHRGGAFSLIQRIPVEKILTSVPEKFHLAARSIPVISCQNGQTWNWEGVTFRMMYPPPERGHQGNNSSCVLRIEAAGGALLLTGDIEKEAEAYLVAHSKEQLPARILVAPHHGSKTSSTLAFITAVAPDYVFFPVGYQNRFHFPKKEVVDRYRSRGIVLADTAEDGAIIGEIGRSGEIKIYRMRKAERKIWR